MCYFFISICHCFSSGGIAMLARHTGISFILYSTSSEDLPQLRLLVQNVYVCTDKCACVCVCTGNCLSTRTVQKKNEWVFQSETGIVVKVLYLDIGCCLNNYAWWLSLSYMQMNIKTVYHMGPLTVLTSWTGFYMQ